MIDCKSSYFLDTKICFFICITIASKTLKPASNEQHKITPTSQTKFLKNVTSEYVWLASSANCSSVNSKNPKQFSPSGCCEVASITRFVATAERYWAANLGSNTNSAGHGSEYTEKPMDLFWKAKEGAISS